MIKNDYITRAKKFVDKFDKYLEVSPYKNIGTAIIDAVFQFNCEHKRQKIKLSSGGTRKALITSDYVIKIDFRETHWGTCDTEYKMWHEAVKDGMEDIFVPITKYKARYYIMPRVTALNQDKYLEWREAGKVDPIDKFTKEQIDYLNDNIEDLHCGNVGYWHRKPVVLDYAANYLRQCKLSVNFLWTSNVP